MSAYLLEAMRHAGIEAAGEVTLEPGADPGRAGAEEIWERVRSAYGVTGPELNAHMAAYFRLGVADLADVSESVLKFVPGDLARKFLVCPVRQEDRRLVVATADPTDLIAEQEIGFVCGRAVDFAVASPGELAEAIDRYYSDDRALEGVLETLSAEADVTLELVEDREPEAVAQEEVSAAPVIKLTNLILREAIEAGASDIHVEGHRGGGLVRFRVDGVLRQYMQLPKSAYTRVLSRLKVLAKLDIADRLRPQDGRARVQMFQKTFDLRLSTVPTRYGEKAVLRILDPENVLDVADLGMTAPELNRFRLLLGYRNGLVVVTGPTGSGKTTTLYAGISSIAKNTINVMTVEDPIEYDLDGVNQIQVETKQDLTFASALRSVLRQDPDVIFVGEIRDRETAQIAIQGCMTGHLVLATLHTNDAIGVIPRLHDLGIDHAGLAATFRGAVGQRLVRRVCPDCVERIEGELTEAEERVAAQLDAQPVVRAVGCRVCGGSGYRGRLPVVEVAVATAELEEGIQRNASTAELVRNARASGMRTLHESVVDHLQAGLTTADEVERVLGETTRDVESHVDRPAAPARPRILFVEDDPVTRKLATRILLREGFEVTETADGEQALDVLARKPDFDLVVTDLHMPKVDGRVLVGEIRRTLATAILPVVVLTASSEPALESVLLEEGADDYIRKPIDPPNFIARVKGVLSRRRLG